MHPLTTAGAVTAGALLVATTATAAGAVPPPRIDLRSAGVGSYALDAAGSARLTGTVTGRPFDGGYTATLSADDGSLPEAGSCEPAAATLHVSGPRGKYVDLAAAGEVCGTWPDATYVVTHDFTGRYVVTDASARRLRGSDGWLGIVLATEGRAGLEAFDS
jgi:hypothetical protein